MANLKFYKKAEAPVGTVEKPLEQGAVWFDSTNGLIHVFNGSTWDAYVGVRDAIVEGEKLTITKRNGTTVSVDFSVYATDEALELLTGRVSTLEGTIATQGGSITDLQGRMTTVEGKAKANEDKLAGLSEATVMAEIAKQVKVADDRALEAEGKLAERITPLEAASADYEERIGVLEAFVSGEEGESVQDLIDSAIAKNNTDVVTPGLASKADKATYEAYEKANNERVGAVEDAVEAEVERATGKEGELAQAIATEKNRIDILVGKDENGAFVDAGKSVRTIATEEVAKIVNETDNDSVDTLKEIAAWIAAHPKDAAEYNARITANEEAIVDIIEEGGTIDAAVAAAEGRVDTKLIEYAKKTDVETSLAAYSTTEQMNAAIKDTDDKAVANATAIEHITKEGGAIATAVSALESSVNGKLNLKANASDVENALAGKVDNGTLTAYQGTVTEALAGKAAVADVQKNADDIAALDAKVTKGLAWAIYE